jgi:hypothetical protein
MLQQNKVGPRNNSIWWNYLHRQHTSFDISSRYFNQVALEFGHPWQKYYPMLEMCIDHSQVCVLILIQIPSNRHV